MKFYVILLLYFLISLSFAEKIISQSMNFHDDRYGIEINFIDISSIFLYINTRNPFTIIVEEDLNQSLLKKDGKNITKLNLFKTYSIYDYMNKITYDNYSINNFNFYILEDKYHFWDDVGLGLGYHFQNEQFSFVHQLYNKHYIDHKYFALLYNKTESTAYIHFGGIPNKGELSFKYRGSCNVDKAYNTWGCNMTKFAYRNKVYNINSYSIIHTCFTEIVYSNFLYDLFVNDILKNEIEKSICVKESTSNDVRWLECEIESLNINESYQFVFGGMQFNFTLKDLMENETGKSRILVFYNPFMNENNKIIFGMKFIRLFGCLSFDYENSLISFYSNTREFISLNKDSRPFLIKIVSILCLFTNVYNIYIYYKGNTIININ